MHAPDSFPGLQGTPFMALQVLQADELQSSLVRALQHHRRRKPCKQGLAPAGGAQTPAVAGLKSCKAPLWPGRAEVVAQLNRKRQKIGRHPGADEVRARVALVGAAAAVAKVAREWVVGAWRQRRSQNVKQCHARKMYGQFMGFDYPAHRPVA